MINKLRNYLSGRLHKFSFDDQIPRMIYGVNHQGEYLSNTRFGNTTTFVSLENLHIGDNVFIGHYNFIEASNKIEISEGVQITNYISILTHSSHISIRLYGREYRKNNELIGYRKGPVKIGMYTFIGPHSTIMPGTTIGKGCQIAAYSLLKGDYPDFSIIEGNPAKVVGDTRSIDKKYLEENPELKEYYKIWTEL